MCPHHNHSGQPASVRVAGRPFSMDGLDPSPYYSWSAYIVGGGLRNISVLTYEVCSLSTPNLHEIRRRSDPSVPGHTIPPGTRRWSFPCTHCTSGHPGYAERHQGPANFSTQKIINYLIIALLLSPRNSSKQNLAVPPLHVQAGESCHRQRACGHWRLGEAELLANGHRVDGSSHLRSSKQTTQYTKLPSHLLTGPEYKHDHTDLR